MGNFISFMRNVSKELHSGGQFGTAHVYRSSLNALISFYGNEKLSFQKVNPELLKQFEIHLRGRNCSWNTVSTYMRTLRAVYNRAVNQRKASYTPYLFRNVYTGTCAERNKSLNNKEMAQLFAEEVHPTKLPNTLSQTKDLFIFMFLLRGLPFVDLAYLRKNDLKGDTITYRRRKTGRRLTVSLTSEALLLLSKHMNNNPSSPYLFPFLKSNEGSLEAYQEYQLALRNFNHQLLQLGKVLGLSYKLSSYTARHTWATMAYYCEIHPGIISEAMGHSSITVTETYLKPFQNKKIDEANRMVINSLKQTKRGAIH